MPVTKISGRKGIVYIDKSSAYNAAATPISNVLQNVSLSFSRDKIDTTCMGDTTKNYVVGLADAQGSFSGIVDIGTANFENILDGNARKAYFYPNATDNATVYWFGNVVCDGSYEWAHSDAFKVSITFAATGDGLTFGPGDV